MNHPVEAIFTEMVDLVHLKAQDYADDANVFSNFENTAMLTGLNTSQVFHVMISIKTERLRQLMSGKTPNFESREDTLKDLANYSALWIAWERQESEKGYRAEELGALNAIVKDARLKEAMFRGNKVIALNILNEDAYPSPGDIAIKRADLYENELTDLYNRGRLDVDAFDPGHPERAW